MFDGSVGGGGCVGGGGSWQNKFISEGLLLGKLMCLPKSQIIFTFQRQI